MKKILTKVVAFLAAITFILGLLPLSWGGKVQAANYGPCATEFAEGEYLIVSSTDGSAYALMLNNGSVGKQEVNIDNGIVTGDLDNCVWVIEGQSSSFTITDKTSNKIIGSQSGYTLEVGAAAWQIAWKWSSDNQASICADYYKLGFNGTNFGCGSNLNKVYFYPVEQKPAVTGVSLDKQSINLKVGEEATLKVTVEPNDADKNVTWTYSTDKLKIEQLNDHEVKVTALSQGETDITVKSTGDNSKSDTCHITVNPASNLEISGAPETMKVEEVITLSASLGEDNVSDQCEWSGNNPDVATVEGGVVTALLPGNVTIKAFYDGQYDTCDIKVIPNVTGVEVTPKTATVRVGKTTQLAAEVTVNLDENEYKKVVWTTSASSIATVDESGKVTAVAEGTATITATSVSDPTVEDTCTVEVLAPAEIMYKKVDTIKAGKKYLIASANSGNVVLLGNSNGSVAKVSETVETGNIISTADQTCIWTVENAGNGKIYLQNNNMYLKGQSNYGNASISSDKYEWKWKNSILWADNSYGLGYDANRDSGVFFMYNNPSDNQKVSFFEEIPTCEGHSIEVDGAIGVQFVMNLSCVDPSELIDSYMEFRIGNQEELIKVNTSDLRPDSEGNYKFTCPVNSLQMADEITATFCNGNDTNSYKYSAKDYIEYIVKNSGGYSTRVVDYVKAMGDYGHYAQLYLKDAHGFEVGDNGKYKYMEACTNELDINQVKTEIQKYKPILVSGQADVKFQMKLSLEAETELIIRASSVSAIAGEATFRERKVDFSNNIVTVPNIKYSEVGTPVMISGTIDGQEFSGSVSVLSYAYTVLNKSADEPTLQQNAMAALYNFYIAANSEAVSQ